MEMSSAGVKSSGSLTNKSNSSVTMSRATENEGEQTWNDNLGTVNADRKLIFMWSVSEEKILAKGYTTPDDVLQLKRITSGKY